MSDYYKDFLGITEKVLDAAIIIDGTYLDPETKTRHVRDSDFWGMPVGTPIVAGMKPKPSVVSNTPRSVSMAAPSGGPGSRGPADPKKWTAQHGAFRAKYPAYKLGRGDGSTFLKRTANDGDLITITPVGTRFAVRKQDASGKSTGGRIVDTLPQAHTLANQLDKGEGSHIASDVRVKFKPAKYPGWSVARDAGSGTDYYVGKDGGQWVATEGDGWDKIVGTYKSKLEAQVGVQNHIDALRKQRAKERRARDGKPTDGPRRTPRKPGPSSPRRPGPGAKPGSGAAFERRATNQKMRAFIDKHPGEGYTVLRGSKGPGIKRKTPEGHVEITASWNRTTYGAPFFVAHYDKDGKRIDTQGADTLAKAHTLSKRPPSPSSKPAAPKAPRGANPKPDPNYRKLTAKLPPNWESVLGNIKGDNKLIFRIRFAYNEGDWQGVVDGLEAARRSGKTIPGLAQLLASAKRKASAGSGKSLDSSDEFAAEDVEEVDVFSAYDDDGFDDFDME